MDEHDNRPAYAALPEMGPGGNLVLRRLIVLGVSAGILFGFFTLFGVMMATGRKPEKKTEAPAAIAVEIAEAVRENKIARIEATGEVKPRTSTELSARASGQITWVNPKLEPGAEVRAGEKLIQIDASNYQLTLETMEADAARAREGLARVKAEANLAAQDYADLGLSEAPSDLALGRPQIASAEAALRAAEARIDEARLALQRTAIAAPYSGRVLRRQVDIGDFVTMGMPVASLFATDIAQIRVPLTNDDLVLLGLTPGFSPAKGKDAPLADITADVAGQVATWTGKLVSVDATIDASTRQTFALIEVAKPFDAGASAPLAPGLFAKVSLGAPTTRSLVRVPRGALKKGTEVYVVRQDSKIDIRKVAPVQADSEAVWLAAGIEPGERVVTSFVPSARTGLEVRDLRAPLPPKPEPEEEPKKKRGDKNKDKDQAAKSTAKTEP